MKFERLLIQTVAIAAVLGATACKRAVKVESSPAPAQPAAAPVNSVTPAR